jgi:hypothetical protein
VTIRPDPGLLAAQNHRGRWSYASPALLRFLAGASLLVGLVAALYGVVYDINGATQAEGVVAVSVQIRTLAGLQIQQATSSGSQRDGPLKLENWPYESPGLTLYVGGVNDNAWVQAGTGSATLRSVGSTVAEQLAGRGGGAVVGLCMGLGALLLRRLLLSVERGQPFQRGNSARIAGIAGLVVVATLSAGVLPYVAARLVLDRLRLSGPGSQVYAHLSISAAPLLLALFLLAFAEAFRRGTELAKDAEGLV